jgi:hypothetical protein
VCAIGFSAKLAFTARSIADLRRLDPTSTRVQQAYPSADSQHGWRRELEAPSATAHPVHKPKFHHPI